MPHSVALLGFSAFERDTLAMYFRLAALRSPAYELVSAAADARLLIVDADSAPAVAGVRSARRYGDAVFIGQRPPSSARAWTMRPIDPLHVLRELDTLLAAAPPEPPRQRRRALLVDDSEIALRFLQSRLAPYPLDTVAVTGSGDALDALAAERGWDFVFVDVELGPASELDGLELCRRIKHLPSTADAPCVVLVSAHASELDRARGTIAGADGYLAKPLDAGELQRLLHRRGLRTQAPLASVWPAV